MSAFIFQIVPSRRRASQQTFRNNDRNHLGDRKEMSRLARPKGRLRLFETAMVTGIALPAATSKMGAAWGERALPPIKRATLLCSSKISGTRSMTTPMQV
jgi:hypothetical protein